MSSREAIDAFVACQEWAKAKKVARELEPKLESYVDARYKEHLKNEGSATDLIAVDVIAALDMFVEQGNFERAIETAGEHGPELKHKYVALQATNFIRDGKSLDALKLYRRHTAPPLEQASIRKYKWPLVQALC